MTLIQRITLRIRRELVLNQNRRRIRSLRNSISSKLDKKDAAPVIFFNSSTRLSGLSQNAGFSLITSLALQAEGIPVIHFVCERGLSHCVLGTNKDNPQNPPPCAECIRTSKMIFNPPDMRIMRFARDPGLEIQLSKMDLKKLLEFEKDGVPLGALIFPSLRWILRRHHLMDDEGTHYLAREYLLSAWNLKKEFEKLLAEVHPSSVVVFNGMTYPEAIARWVARQKNIPVYSHEVGMLPFSAFFTDKDATAYPVKVDKSFILSEFQNIKLDDYLEHRFKGKFVTAGVKFWQEMKSLDKEFLEKAKRFKAIVPVFTNVVFDTSQSHANVVFDQMFDWLDTVLEQIKANTDTLFVIRAHPDELRPGKESRETVAEWVSSRSVDKLPNVIFIPSNKFISSYDLIRIGKFVMVYNSTIGLEASIMDKPVLCAGQARYTLIPTVFFPRSRKDYRDTLVRFLEENSIINPIEFRRNARRVLYSQLFRASLPFDKFLEEDRVWQGYVRLKEFKLDDMTPEKSSTIQVILDGILKPLPFIRDI
jgi:capsule polysaccharide modification protein KpsS